jgi:hypothetical protein
MVSIDCVKIIKPTRTACEWYPIIMKNIAPIFINLKKHKPLARKHASEINLTAIELIISILFFLRAYFRKK